MTHKNRTIRFFVITLALVLLLAAFSWTASAAATSGDCGISESGQPSDQVTWEYRADEKTLWIRGTGYMNSYHVDFNTAPWWDYKDEIENVVIADGVKGIGDYAFCFFSKLKTLYFPGSVERIGHEAAYKCASLERVTMDEGVREVGTYAFYSCPKLTEAYVPSTLQTLGYKAFGQSSLKTVRFGARSEAERNYGGESGFDGIAEDCQFLYNEAALHYEMDENGHYRTDPYGEVHYQPGKHNFAKQTDTWNGDVCTVSKACKDCGYVLTATVVGAYRETEPGTCASPSMGQYVAQPPQFDPVSTPKNSVVGILNPNAHQFGEWTVTKEATCVKEGVETRSCLFCDAEETRKIDRAESHDYGEWKVITAPTCTSAGKQERVCKECGKKETAAMEGYQHEVRLANKGTVHYYRCDLCGACFYDAEGQCPIGDPVKCLAQMEDTYLNAAGVRTALPESTILFGNLASITIGEDGETTSCLVGGNSTVDRRVEIKGNVQLILLNGAELTCKEGIHVCSGAALTVFAQSADKKNMGALTVPAAPAGSAGIGDNQGENNSTVTICGGKLDVSGGANGAGIGGGGSGKDNAVIVKDGIITAAGGESGAGIGGGAFDCNTILTIDGGTITAQGGTNGAGIGGGNGSDYATVTIQNGTVTAKGGRAAAGIGNGSDGNHGTVILKGGAIKANKGKGDPAEDIGHGYRGTCVVMDSRTDTAEHVLPFENWKIIAIAAGAALIVIAAIVIAVVRRRRAAAFFAEEEMRMFEEEMQMFEDEE